MPYAQPKIGYELQYWDAWQRRVNAYEELRSCPVWRLLRLWRVHKAGRTAVIDLRRFGQGMVIDL